MQDDRLNYNNARVRLVRKSNEIGFQDNSIGRSQLYPPWAHGNVGENAWASRMQPVVSHTFKWQVCRLANMSCDRDRDKHRTVTASTGVL